MLSTDPESSQVYMQLLAMMKAKMKLRTTLRNPISDKKHRKPLLNSGTSEAAQGPFTSLEKQGVVAFKKESHAMVLLHRHTQ